MSASRVGSVAAGGISWSDRFATEMARGVSSARRNTAGFLSCVILAVIPCACATIGEQNPLHFNRAPLLGMVYDGDNGPCSGARVTVDGAEVVVSDVNGRFVIPALTQGAHAVSLAAEGYEPIEVKIEFSSRSQVLYVKMLSFEQLIETAAHAVDAGEWAPARAFLRRALILKPRDPKGEYLSAVVLFRTRHYREAEALLRAMIEAGSEEPYLYLFLADLLEYHLGRRKEAAEALSAFVERAEDPEIEGRLEHLRSTNETR